MKLCRTDREKIIKSRGKQKLSEGTAANRTRDIDPGSEELATVRKSSKRKQMKQTEPVSRTSLTFKETGYEEKTALFGAFQETKASGNLFLVWNAEMFVW